MAFQIIRNDLTKMQVDAIVNTANPEPLFASGTDTAIYRAAGEQRLLEERKKIGYMDIGEARETAGFDLPCKYIIHTVGPSWMDGEYDELNDLHKCYRHCFQLAKKLGCESIAFPLISTGNYGFPKDKALQIALAEFSEFLLKEEMQIYLVVFDKESYQLSTKLFNEIDSFIDHNYVVDKQVLEYGVAFDVQEETSEVPNNLMVSAPDILLADIVRDVSATFQERLFEIIQEKELDETAVYKAANLDRKLFSKIRCNPDYKPKKKTAVALALAMKLSLTETKDLLERAEFALSPSSKFDLIIEYCISHQIYDVYQINVILFEHDLPTLGE